MLKTLAVTSEIRGFKIANVQALTSTYYPWHYLKEMASFQPFRSIAQTIVPLMEIALILQ